MTIERLERLTDGHVTDEEILDTLDWERDNLHFLESSPRDEWTERNAKRKRITIQALEMAIEALKEEMPKRPTCQPWVSVEDRLPDGDVASVLIYTNEGGVSEGQYYPSIKSWKQFRWSVENADVTHWKPLPAPPKEEMI